MTVHRIVLLVLVFSTLFPEPSNSGPWRKKEKLRGVNVPVALDGGSIRALGTPGWGASVVRWQITFTGDASCLHKDAYLGELHSSLNFIMAQISQVRGAGIGVVLDLHHGPGGKGCGKMECSGGGPVKEGGSKKKSSDCIFRTRVDEETFIEAWKMISARFRNVDTVIGYDLLNEPIGPTKEWRRIAGKTARAIRAQCRRNPGECDKTPIIVESIGGDPRKLADFPPLPMRFNPVVYSVHVYNPLKYTGQGIEEMTSCCAPDNMECSMSQICCSIPYCSDELTCSGEAFTPRKYPRRSGKRPLTKKALSEVLKVVSDYKKEHKVQIFIGEFGAPIWAPGNCSYLRDLINIFEREKFHWAYHIHRESPLWKAEGTRRETLLRGSFIPGSATDLCALPPQCQFLAPVVLTSKEPYWTIWFNESKPTKNREIEAVPYSKISKKPIEIDCQTVDGRDWSETGDWYACELPLGGLCYNPSGQDCHDYKIRLLLE